MNYDGFIREEISVDVSLPNYFTPPLIKEGDRGTRGFKVTITDGGEPIEIPDEGTEIWFNCRNRSNPEKHGSNRGVVNADGTVNVDVPAVVMDVPGMVECDISIITSVQGSDEPSILKTTLFCLNCEAAANKNGTTTAAEDNILAKIVAGEINPPGGANYEHVVEVVGDDLDHADRNDTLYIHKVGNRVKGLVFVAGDVPPYQGCTQYRLRKSGSVEYRFGALNLTTDPYSYDWGGYSATGDWKRLATLDDIPEAVNPWKNKRYLSHGDSITWYDGQGYLWGEHKGEIATGYQTIMKELLGLSYNRATDNKGRSGYTIAHNYEGSHDGSDNLVDVIADVNIDYTAYDLCTILGGTNDYRRATPLGELGQTGDDYESLDTDTFYGAYRKCVEYILTAAPDIRLVLITPFQRDPYSAWSSYEATYDGNKPNAEGLKLIDYVNAVKMIGKMYGLSVCDLYSNSGITELTLSTYTIDGLHPNDDGFKRIGEVLASTLTSGGNNDAADLSKYAKKSDIPLDYVFVNEIPADADHAKKYVLPDGYIYEWHDGTPAVIYDANTTQYSGTEAFKNRQVNIRPTVNQSYTNLESQSGVLTSGLIPFSSDWTASGETVRAQSEVVISGLSTIVPAYNSSVFVYYYRADGSWLTGTYSKFLTSLKPAGASSRGSIPNDSEITLPLSMYLKDSGAGSGVQNWNNVGFVRILIGVSKTGDITEQDIANVSFHVPYYDSPGTEGGWVSTGVKHPYYTTSEKVFDVDTDQVLYAVGDSITYGYVGDGVPRCDSWVKYVIDHNGYDAVNSRNLGESGIGFCCTYGGRNAMNVVNDNNFSAADIVTVALGINDWKSLENIYTLTEFYTAMYGVFSKIRSDNPWCRIYFILPFNGKRAIAGSTQADGSEGIKESTFYWLNTKVRADYGKTYCAGYTLLEFIGLIKAKFTEADFKALNVEIIDMVECPAINRHNMDVATVDGLHPSAETHAELGKEIARLLSVSRLKEPSPSKVSELTNDSGYLTLATLPKYNGGVQ